MKKTIGILGCGWLGFSLAKSCIAKGYRVHGSTTSKEKLRTLENMGIAPFLIQLQENSINGNITDFLKNIDSLVINVPPKLRRNPKENFIGKMELLHATLKKSTVQKLIFVSSTSVYGDMEGEITEEAIPAPSTESGKQLLASEHIFIDNAELKTTILRFGGLIGADRHPISMLSGKTGLSNGNSPVNLIHKDDCIGIILAIIENDWWGEIFNAVYPLYPLKRQYYSQEAQKRGLPLPDYGNESLKKGKIVRPYNLLNVKKYHFKTSIVS
ncbi:SDR family oxidoreductase [Maribacter halichondriae]|uniref:SDR family oxidoreductase n=1 Tax=Maribacter halichondriae TaxID=2980554 RepID=UPI00235858D7|nr:SDR family oxidoreductase [Maribacter sp. Hal144]